MHKVIPLPLIVLLVSCGGGSDSNDSDNDLTMPDYSGFYSMIIESGKSDCTNSWVVDHTAFNSTMDLTQDGIDIQLPDSARTEGDWYTLKTATDYSGIMKRNGEFQMTRNDELIDNEDDELIEFTDIMSGTIDLSTNTWSGKIERSRRYTENNVVCLGTQNFTGDRLGEIEEK